MNGSGLPRVTVLMPVYNAEPFLAQAIQSILHQTYSDFEFLIIDDGSTDNSYEIAASFADPRIRLIRQSVNLGLVTALNLGLDCARGEYIARMDADDISLPERLSRQVRFLDTNQDIAVCGTWLQTIAENKMNNWYVPLNHTAIHVRLLFGSAIFHATVLMRKASLNEYAVRYLDGFSYAEDYEFWSRCVLTCRFANLGEILYYYRIHDNSSAHLEPDSKQRSADMVRLQWLNKVGVQPTEEEMILHRHLSLGTAPLPLSVNNIEKCNAWLLKIRSANLLTKIFPEPELSKELSNCWFMVCNQSTSLGPTVASRYFRSPLSINAAMKKRALLAFMIKSILRWSGK